MLATKAVLDGSDLTLTKIGRALDTDTTVKHAIKRIDRLLGNRNLHREKNPYIDGMPPLLHVPIHFPWCWLIGQMFENNCAI